MRPRWLQRHGLALAVIALPPFLWLWPVVSDPFHTIIGWPGDNLYYVRQFWWAKHALLVRHISPFFDPWSYAPLGYSLTRGELSPANTLPGMPLVAIAGPVFTYNLAVLMSFLLTAIGVYGWAYRLSASRAGAVVAAIIASMPAFRLAHATGHLPTAATQGFALALWSFEEMLHAPEDRGRRRWALALGGSVALAALSSWYYAFAAAVMLPIYGVLRMRAHADYWRSGPWWKAVGLAALVAGLLVLPFAIPYVRASLDGGLRRTFAETESWSLNAYDFFIPNVAQPWWTAAMAARFPWQSSGWAERAVSLGYVATALALLALIRCWRASSHAVSALVKFGLVSAAFALGPLLYWGDHRVLLDTPHIVRKTLDWFLYRIEPASPLREQFWTARLGPVPLPALLLMLLPGASGMRSFARFAYWTVLSVAALSAFSIRWLIERGGRGAPIAVALLACAVVVESWSARTISRLEPRPIDHWIAEQPADEVVVELPLEYALSNMQDYYVTIQQHSTVLGPRNDSYSPPALYERAAVMSNLPEDASMRALREWGATLLIVHLDAVADRSAWEAALGRAGARFAASFGEVTAYRLPKSAQSRDAAATR